MENVYDQTLWAFRQLDFVGHKDGEPDPVEIVLPGLLEKDWREVLRFFGQCLHPSIPRIIAVRGALPDAMLALARVDHSLSKSARRNFALVALRHHNVDIRTAAARMLTVFSDPNTVPLLLDAYKEEKVESVQDVLELAIGEVVEKSGGAVAFPDGLT